MAEASEQPVELHFSRVFVFGDSLSDNGNRAELRFWTRFRHWLVRCLLRLFRWKLKNAYQGGRESNGLVAVEEIAKQFSTAVEPAWKVKEGTNFAVSGALTSKPNGVPTLTYQIEKFLDRFLDDGALPADALYIVYIGGNDIMRAAKKCIADGEEIVDTSVSDIDRCLCLLAGRGARKFLVPNRGDVGNTPHFRRFWSRPHRGRRATLLSMHFNCQLALALDRFETKLGYTIARFESFSFGRQLRADASKHGWTNLSASCLRAGCDASFDEYFFFDRFHPTAKRHKLNGDAFCRTIYDTFGRQSGQEELV